MVGDGTAAAARDWLRTPAARIPGDPVSQRRTPATPWGPAIRVATWILKPLLLFWTRPTWRGLRRVPGDGPLILAVNHISLADPIAIADLCVYGIGRIPSFLAKASLFSLPVAGAILTGAHQIPVRRDLPDGGGALDAATQALRNGGCAVIYPEGSITRDPDGWPMTGHTGVARLALESGAPVHPIGQWGAQRLLGSPRASASRPRPRTRITAVVGPEVDLNQWRGRPVTPDTLSAATSAVMAAIASCVAEARGAPMPAGPPFDPRSAATPAPE